MAIDPRRLLDTARTLPHLGLGNVARVGAYRLASRAGWYVRRLPPGRAYPGPFWQAPAQGLAQRDDLSVDLRGAVCAEADEIRSGLLTYFSARRHAVGFPPAWRRPPGAHADWPLVHWSSVAEFADGDIKLVWEASRFHGLTTLSAAAVAAEDAAEREVAFLAAQTWISSWVNDNPFNLGPNWRCAQETALRLIATLIADRLLRDAGAWNAPALERFVDEHCRRVAPTMHYAIAQDNNHATSEAAGLYIGGLWLQRFASDTAKRARGKNWMRTGRDLFERLVRRLVMADGSFSQYSVNYHRLLLDTACVLEIARRDADDAPLSIATMQRLSAAAGWLATFTDSMSGDAPNLGANDGARLLQLSRAGYRDFRPHTQLAAALFCGEAAWPPSPQTPTDDLCRWFGVPVPSRCLPPAASRLYSDGGYAVLVRGDLRVLLRLPVFRFRPSHADLLHVDVWWRGRNVIRDGGSFSYNTDERWLRYFPGAAAHSTVQFGDREPMPRLSRFLYGRWPSPHELRFDANSGSVSCAYRDYRGAIHRRELRVDQGCLDIIDDIAFAPADSPTVLRLRLAPGEWRVTDEGVESDDVSVHVHVDTGRSAELTLAGGWESREYSERTALQVLECRVRSAPTRVHWTLLFR